MSVKLDFSVKPVRSKKPVTQMKQKKKPGMKCKTTIPKYFKYAKFYFVHTKNIFLGFLEISHLL